MGREITAELTFQGRHGSGKLLLEAAEIIIRGDLRARIARDTITDLGVDGDDLVMATAQGQLRAHIGAVQATAWVKAMAKPAPSLAQKLGLSVNALPLVIGPLTDTNLIAAITASQSDWPTLDAPAMIVIEMNDALALTTAQTALQAHPTLPIWCVTIKGQDAPVSDATLRQFLRAIGYIDTKSCAVSARMTATRFSKRQI